MNSTANLMKLFFYVVRLKYVREAATVFRRFLFSSSIYLIVVLRRAQEYFIYTSAVSIMVRGNLADCRKLYPPSAGEDADMSWT